MGEVCGHFLKSIEVGIKAWKDGFSNRLSRGDCSRLGDTHDLVSGCSSRGMKLGGVSMVFCGGLLSSEAGKSRV